MIIGLVGHIGNGKGAVADVLVERHNFVKDSFACPLKVMTSVLFGWDTSLLEGDTPESREFRETVDKYWSDAFGYPVTPRKILQLMGTEAGRDVFHEDIWVHSLKNRMLPQLETRNFVIADVRFPNEIKMINDLGGKVVRVKRGENPPWYMSAFMQNTQGTTDMTDKYPDIHYSEWAWIGDSGISLTMDNNCSIDQLPNRVDMMLDWLYNTHMEDNFLEQQNEAES